MKARTLCPGFFVCTERDKTNIAFPKMNNKKAIGVVFLTTFLDLLGFGLIIPILPLFTKELGATDAQIGLIAAVYALMNFSFSPLWGRLSDRYGRRPIILVSVLITALAYVVFAQAHNLWILLASRILSGIGSANIGAAQAYVGDVTEPKERAKTMGLIGAAFGLGFIAGPPIGGYIKELYGIGVLGYTTAGLSMVNFALAYFFLPESLKKELRTKVVKVENIFNSLWEQLKKPQIGKIFVINILMIIAFSMMQVSAALIWKEESGLDGIGIGKLFMFIGLCSAIVQGVLVGPISKRFGERQMLAIGLTILVVGLAAMPHVQADRLVPYQYIDIALIALAIGFINPALMSLVTLYASPKELGYVTGLFQSFGSLGRAIGPTVGGAMYGWSHHLPYEIGPVLVIVALFLSRTLTKAKPPDLSDELEPDEHLVVN